MQGPVSVAASAKLGKVIDLAWLPLPAPIGGGSVVVVAGEDGSLAVVDATQTVEHRSLRKRLAAFKNLVGGRWPFPQVLLLVSLNLVNITANAMVIGNAAISRFRYPAKIAWCAHVTDAPDDNKIIVLRNGISQ